MVYEDSAPWVANEAINKLQKLILPQNFYKIPSSCFRIFINFHSPNTNFHFMKRVSCNSKMGAKELEPTTASGRFRYICIISAIAVMPRARPRTVLWGWVTQSGHISAISDSPVGSAAICWHNNGIVTAEEDRVRGQGLEQQYKESLSYHLPMDQQTVNNQRACLIKTRGWGLRHNYKDINLLN